MSLGELVDAARPLLAGIEQPMFDVISIESSEIEDAQALVSYATELAWVDRTSWQERSLHGVLALEYQRGESGWVVSGLAYVRRAPEVTPPRERVAVPTPGRWQGRFGTARFDRGARPDLFSIWF
jgi:hypothetical protein